MGSEDPSGNYYPECSNALEPGDAPERDRCSLGQDGNDMERERSGESEPVVEPVVKPEPVPEQPTEPSACQPADILPNLSEGPSWNIRWNLVLNRLRTRRRGGDGLRTSSVRKKRYHVCTDSDDWDNVEEVPAPWRGCVC